MTPTACACTKLRRSARAVTAMYDAAIVSTGLTTPQFALLRMLDRAGACSLSALAVQTGHDRTSISRMVTGLVQRGLITFAPGKDQRERIVATTAAGLAALASARHGWEVAEARIDAALGADRAVLFALLDRIEAMAA